MKLSLVILTFVVGCAVADRPSSQPVNPSVCVNKFGEKPDSRCTCKVFIKDVQPPSYYLKWKCPNEDPKKPLPTAPASAPAVTPTTRAATPTTPASATAKPTTKPKK